MKTTMSLWSILIFAAVVCSCADSSKKTATFTADQQGALDALTLLQVSVDTPSRLYSTFAGQQHTCYPPDTTFVITQEKFEAALTEFVNIHHKSMTSTARQHLAKKAALAQGRYTVHHCVQEHKSASHTKGLSRSGTWILPNVLQVRDVVLVW